ncbi:hypothetical protein [Sorangium sp. So ce1000]|uniref:hypothetical protein n=1 Tax=Sorangium sp. So ce1000 TaxID=3133325 RepID=UPI003F5E99CC
MDAGEFRAVDARVLKRVEPGRRSLPARASKPRVIAARQNREVRGAPALVARAPSIEDPRARNGMIELLIRLFSRFARRSTARGVIEVIALLGDLDRLRVVTGVRAARQLDDAERPACRGNSGDASEQRRALRDRPGCDAVPAEPHRATRSRSHGCPPMGPRRVTLAPTRTRERRRAGA